MLAVSGFFGKNGEEILLAWLGEKRS